MKKLNLFSMLVAVVALLATSCSIDNFDYAQSGEECVVALSAQVPSAVGSRADVVPGNAAEVKKMSYWVYRVEGSTWTYLPNLSGVTNVTTGEATTISLSLLKSLEYNVILWADAFGFSEDSPYSYNHDTYDLTMNFSKIVANNEKLDAFFGATTIQANPVNQGHSITLSRPFAQLNFGTSDLDEVEANGITLHKTGIELECANVLNLNTGEVSGEQVREYTPTAIPVGYQFPYNSDDDLISLNYILVGTESVTTAVTLNYTMDADDYTLSVNAPLQRNRRTNVYGGMLIGGNSLLSVSIRDSFHDSSNTVQGGYDPKEDPEPTVPGGSGSGGDAGDDPF